MEGFRLAEFFVEDVQLIQERKIHVLEQIKISRDVKDAKLFIYAVRKRECFIVMNALIFPANDFGISQNGG